MSSEIRVNKINNRVGLGTVSFTDTGPVVSGIVTASLGLRVPDNVYSYFGTGNDLSIRHDAAGGNHSYIFNTGAGVFKLASDTQMILGETTDRNYIQMNPNSDVKLFFNNSQKLATSNTGVTVTGTAVATSFSGSGENLTNLTASQLIGALPAISGANLTNLPPSAPVGGASTNPVFFENAKEVAVNYQITSTKNAMSAGPIAINAGIAVTVPSGSAWTIV